MDKKIITLVSGIGLTVGGYIPVLFGASGLSGWSLLGGFIGGVVGIWLGIQLSQ